MNSLSGAAGAPGAENIEGIGAGSTVSSAPDEPRDDSGTIPDPLVIVNAARHRRLELISELNAGDVRPGLAACRALDAAYRVAAGEPGAAAELEAALREGGAALEGEVVHG